MADAPEKTEKPERERGNPIDRLRMALQMSGQRPELRGIAEGMTPIVDVLDGHETRLNDHDAKFGEHEKRFGEHDETMQMLGKVAQDYLQRRIDKRDRADLFGKWNAAYGKLDDAGRKDMDGRAKLLRDKFLEARKLGAPEAKEYEGLDDDEAVSRAVLNQLRAFKKSGADPMEVFRNWSDQMGYKPEEIQAAIVSDAEPGKETLSREGGSETEGAEAQKKEDKAIDKAEKSEKPKDKGENPDAAEVRERAKSAPQQRAGGQDVMSAEDLLKIKRKYGGKSKEFRDALRANASAKTGL